MKSDVLVQMAVVFAVAAVASFGGIAAIIPEIHRQTVEVHHWIDDGAFASAFALSQIAPGPNILLSSMVGWRVAGLSGLVIATLATIGPTALIAYLVARAETRLQRARWYGLMRKGLPPIVVGLIFASGLITARAAIHDWLGVALAAAVALTVAFVRVNPLAPLAAAVVIGVAASHWAG